MVLLSAECDLPAGLLELLKEGQWKHLPRWLYFLSVSWSSSCLFCWGKTTRTSFYCFDTAFTPPWLLDMVFTLYQAF